MVVVETSKYKAEMVSMKTEVGNSKLKYNVYNEYVRNMFGGGDTSGPAMKKKGHESRWKDYVMI